jgi:hypothetical protein
MRGTTSVCNRYLEKREPFYSKAKIIYETEVLVTREDVNEYVRKLIKLL